MSRLMKASVTTALCILSFVLACAALVQHWPHLALVPTANAQGDDEVEKTILVNKLHRLDALEVDRVLESGRVVRPAEPSEDNLKWLQMGNNLPVLGRQFREAYTFRAGDDWLKDLSLVLKNRTSKSIVYIGLKLRFPQTKAEGPEAAGMFGYGRIPDAVAHDSSEKKLTQGESARPLLLAPGQQVTLSVGEHAEEMRAGLEGVQSFPSISLCYIEFAVYFEDGMAWLVGHYVAPDPNQPGRTIPMDKQYFPGPVRGLPGS